MREVRALLAPWLRSPRTGVLLALAPILETIVFAIVVGSANRRGGGGIAGASPRLALFASLVVLASVLPCVLAPLYAASALATDRDDRAAALAARTGSQSFDAAFVAELLRSLCLVWASAPLVLLAYVVLRPAGGLGLCLGLHAVAYLAVAASTAASALAPSRVVAGVAGYTALLAGAGVVLGLAWRLAPYHRAAGIGGAELALPALCAAVALGFTVVGRAAGRRRGAHYR